MAAAFSYIIPFYNSRETIKDTMDSVIASDVTAEIILVDDCSRDGTRDIIDSYPKGLHKIKYTLNRSRLGAALSRNVGAAMAEGDILVFLDADIVVPPNASVMVREYLTEGRVKPQPDAMVANRAKECLYRDPVSMYKNYWTSFNFSKLKGWTSFLCSSFFAIKKDAFLGVGGFRKINQVEDNDLGHRLALNNYRIYFAPDLAVFHKKRFNLSSLLKREFIAGREGIKIKIRNAAFGDLVKDRKFFAVNKNFIYSFPFAVLFAISVFLACVFRNSAYLAVSVLCLSATAFLNREFLGYASCSKDYPKGILYLFLMMAQLNAIALGMFWGLVISVKEHLTRLGLLITAYMRSFYRLFAKGFLPPEQVTFFVTSRCNLSCGHCFVNKDSVAKDEELTADEIDRISKSIGRVSYLTITGGEPFIRDDIADIVRILSKNLRPILVAIPTNGCLTDLVVEKVSAMLEDCKYQDILVKVSIDGPKAVHDKMRSVPGAFDKACSTFMKLSNLKKIYRNLAIGILTTYTEQNSVHIGELYEKVISVLGPDQYALVLERPASANRLNRNIDIDNYLNAYKMVNAKMLASTKGFFRKFRLAYKMRMAQILRDVYRTERYPLVCYAGRLNAVVAPNGDVFACEQLERKFGNLREADYDWAKVWNSAEAAKIKDLIKKKSCFCTNECYLPFNISYNIKECLGVLGTYMANSVFKRSAA